MAAFAAMATVLAQPMLSPCQCSGVASADGCCAASAKPCCGGGDSCSSVAAECRCEPAGLSHESQAFGCLCEASSPESPAPVPASSVRIADAQSDSLLLAAAVPLVANFGLHGSPWATAFDLEAPGGLLGIRLHALLSVWRN